MSWSSRDLAASVLAVALAQPAVAQVTPSIAVGGRVTAASNPFLLPGGGGAVYAEGSIEPSLAIERADGSSLSLDGVLAGREYSRTYGGYILGSATASGLYRDSEKLSLTGLAAYERDIAADTLTDDAGGAADPRSIRNTWRARAAASWRPTALDTVTPSFDYERIAYEDNPALLTGTAYTADLGYSRRLSERTSIGVRGLARRSKVGDGRFTTLGLFATFDRRLSPVWRLNGDLGAERVRQGRALAGLGRSQTSFTGRLRLCADGERVTGCLDASLASEVSPLGGVQRRYSAGASATWRLGPRLDLEAEASYQKAERGRQSVAPGLGGALARLQLAWRMDRRTTITGDLEYRRRDFGFGRSADGVFAGAGIRWGTAR